MNVAQKARRGRKPTGEARHQLSAEKPLTRLWWLLVGASCVLGCLLPLLLLPRPAYGRKVSDDLRKGTPAHLYLPGPHRDVWNEQALAASSEIILCEALIDVMTFWCAGFTNVTAAYGVEGFTPDHLAALLRHGVTRMLIAYDRDDAGDKAAAKLAAQLMERGIEC